ncbi:MAG: hypothetical protein PF588_04350 [Candidatus Kapabacteria bacterium]|nr:hypothetical protein [Candidatus Kapabacteria bacterium]
MKRLLPFLLIPIILLLVSCEKKNETKSTDCPQSNEKCTVEEPNQKWIETTVDYLSKKYGNENRDRLLLGVTQVHGLWHPEDGCCQVEFHKFIEENYINDDAKRKELFERLQRNFEIIIGHNGKVNLELTEPVHVAIGDMIPVDGLFAAYSPSAHFDDDMYKSKIAFIVALNFPAYTLAEKNELGPKWTRLEWAYARMGDMFTSRVPAALNQAVSTAMSTADNYISNYNIFAGKLVDKDFNTFFPEDMKLITHWNLRDELKSQYANKESGLQNQEMIYQVMQRIIDQSIPQEVINKGDYQWDPYENKIYKDKKEIPFTAEADVRYDYLRKNFLAMKAIDEYTPQYPTYIERAFDKGLEYSKKEIEDLFVTLCSSPQVAEVGALIKKRLGRDLRPFDIWYDGFKSRSSISEDDLDKQTMSKYPNPAAVHADLDDILVKLGFTIEKAQFIASKIQVDPSRGAGHAWGSQMKSDVSHLRSRIGEKGMNYKGYNIAVHEFGHNTEQTLTLHDVDNYMMSGVPNTAFTESWAFIFQHRDLYLLGMKENNPDKKYLDALDNFWSVYEIMGVSLVDMNVWEWLYANPECTKTELKEAVINIAKDIWNKYYAPVFGMKDQSILAVYSHMIDYPLYLSAYPIGHIAEFQIEQFIEGKNLGSEMIRICSQGRLTPDIWMQGAVGNKLMVEPTLKATEEALKHIK